MHIKSIYLYAVLCCIIASLVACGNDPDNSDFDGVGKLISSRNSARHKKAKDANKKIKRLPKKVQNNDQDKVSVESQTKNKPQKKKFSSQIFYEEKIKIISTASNDTLGIGTAYLNKDGKIVQIKIKRN